MIGPGPPHGRLATLVLQGDRVRVVLVPALGARVVSLVDLATGCDWLVGGSPPAGGAALAAWASPAAVFDGSVAYGWDECLPTVAPCPDPLDPAASPLRDHGDAWGRPAGVATAAGALVSTWDGRAWPWRLRREIRLDGPAIEIEYLLENRGSARLPFLYAMHALLALPRGSRLEVADLSTVRVAAAPGYDLAGGLARTGWPRPGVGATRWDEVASASAGLAAKLYAGRDGDEGEALPGRASVTAPDGSRLELAWDAAVLPALGIWLDDGGWPPGDGRVQHALEPMSSPDDDLASAIARDRACVVDPGGRLTWRAAWRVRAPGEPAA